MEIPIVIEPIAGNSFRASSCWPLPLETQAATRDEAVQKLQVLIDQRIRAGVEFASVEVPNARHPLAAFAGILKDDPLLEQWKEAWQSTATVR